MIRGICVKSSTTPHHDTTPNPNPHARDLISPTPPPLSRSPTTPSDKSPATSPVIPPPLAPYAHAPPHAFLPYIVQPHEVLARARAHPLLDSAVFYGGAAGQGPERDVLGTRPGGGPLRQPARLRQPPLEAARRPRLPPLEAASPTDEDAPNVKISISSPAQGSPSPSKESPCVRQGISWLLLVCLSFFGTSHPGRPHTDCRQHHHQPRPRGNSPLYPTSLCMCIK